MYDIKGYDPMCNQNYTRYSDTYKTYTTKWGTAFSMQHANWRIGPFTMSSKLSILNSKSNNSENTTVGKVLILLLNLKNKNLGNAINYGQYKFGSPYRFIITRTPMGPMMSLKLMNGKRGFMFYVIESASTLYYGSGTSYDGDGKTRKVVFMWSLWPTSSDGTLKNYLLRSLYEDDGSNNGNYFALNSDVDKYINIRMTHF